MPTGVTAIRGTITGITGAEPPVVTSVAHGLSNGEFVKITEVDGPVQLNNRPYRVFNTTADTFELQDPGNRENVDASSLPAYFANGREIGRASCRGRG